MASNERSKDLCDSGSQHPPRQVNYRFALFDERADQHARYRTHQTFDKSTLQSFNPGEALWFDCFYKTNITPLFLR